MLKVGYFEGTDPIVLSILAAKGVDTLPLGNGEDGCGKYIGHITKEDNISLIVGYLHKVIPLSEQLSKPSDILYSCIAHNIPVMILVPKEFFDDAKKILGDAAEKVKIIDPKDALDELTKILG
ncbi:hypothetical protein LR066_01095 [candidate division WOR-3 bacterium]|nr:hypothetical protein [candidate division WOR-3 bacterium]